MRKTPSYLKGLAETRARIAGDMDRLNRLIAMLSEQRDLAADELSACDRLIRKFDQRLDPTHIAPIKAWAGRYGKRGALKEAIKEYLQSAYPGTVSTRELSAYLRAKFELNFCDWRDTLQWAHNSLGNALKDLVQKGVIQRLHDPSVPPTGEAGRWLWVQKTSSLDGLSAMAEAAGVAVVEGVVDIREKVPL